MKSHSLAQSRSQPCGLIPGALAALIGLTLVLTGNPSRAAIEANQATQAELETVSGIGPNLSIRILKARHEAAFRDWPDLMARVEGVGPSNAARMSRAGLTVAGTPYAREAGESVRTVGKPQGVVSAPLRPTRPGG